MARINNLTNFLTDVADAIRRKTGGSAVINAEDFDTEIDGIESGVMTQAEYDSALKTTEEILGTIGTETAKEVGPILNNILDVQQANDAGGDVSTTEAVLDNILGGAD